MLVFREAKAAITRTAPVGISLGELSLVKNG